MSEDPSPPRPPDRKARVTSFGLRLDDQEMPLHAGTIHYWHLDRAHWRSCLEAVRQVGFRLVDLYIPWGVHETAPGKLDLGQHNPRLDVAAFLAEVHRQGLCAVVRPGPHINAELTYFGLPERIVWDEACQARSPKGNPVVLPMVPTMFPVPSYASEAYLDEATRYYHLIGEVLAPLRYPDGPIVMVQVDNEGAMFFRDGPYDQDHHPDAIRKYRDFLRDRYGTIDTLRGLYPHLAEHGSDLRFTDIDPPAEFDVEQLAALPFHLDWAIFQEVLLADAIGRLGEALESAGLTGLVTTHNFPLAQERTPLNPARVGNFVDLVGYDYYGRATERDRATIARRTSELDVRSRALGFAPYACELGAGYPPFFPPLSERDSAFVVLTALAYGLRGFNVYMAVERDRWVGAPIDATGRLRPFADFWQRLLRALNDCEFHRLERRTPVRLVYPRIEQRLARLTHAFGPASGPLLAVLGQGPRESCFEDDFGIGYPLAVEADTFLRSFEQALEARGVPFAWVGGEDRDVALDDAAWLVCASSGAMPEALATRLVAATDRGTRVTIGPRRSAFDARFRPLEEAAAIRNRLEGACEWHESDAPALADAAVARAVADLDLCSYAADPDPLHVTVHHDGDGEIRVAFVINATDEDLVGRVTIGVDDTWSDPIETMNTRSERGVLELRLRPHSVRMLIRRRS